ncbi:hypothetical protein [Fluviicola chungangensis]|uniref:Winged helix-turn-helix transcriptional regulator n=1 Tax=Fluviicola chungangensis TaxID=2597671 RepID=A0A556MQ14_9FLAO|nr:hypothetical protein [Fluviicola chungangensis]TSJ41898.1 hypothetical protein FO442_12460 [Fluviicola chungangensis]
MGAKKKHIFTYETNRNAELGLVISASARIEILEYLDNHQIMNIPMLEQFIRLHKKTLNHHVNLIERSGLIKGFYLGNTYFWSKNEDLLEEWDKIRWAFTTRG